MEPDAPVNQDDASDSAGFTLALSNFEGPFDLLLQLISSKKLDVTEVALSKVTDEFIAYTRMLGETADLDETTEFLVVAATLLDLKAARLLQYKAYKQVAELFADWQRTAQKRYPRAASLEDRFVNLLPPVTLSHSPDSFAELAATVFRPKPPDVVGTDHLHQVAVSVPEQAGKLLDVLRMSGEGTWLTFAILTKDCQVSMEVVGRFLAILELYKAQAVSVEQEESLGDLKIAWTGLNVDPAVVAASNWA